MLDSVDIWLAEHAELAVPTLPFDDRAEGTANNRVAAARAIACMLALARDYKLKRFAEAAKKRWGFMHVPSPYVAFRQQQAVDNTAAGHRAADFKLVLEAQMDLVLEEAVRLVLRQHCARPWLSLYYIAAAGWQ